MNPWEKVAFIGLWLIVVWHGWMILKLLKWRDKSRDHHSAVYQMMSKTQDHLIDLERRFIELSGYYCELGKIVRKLAETSLYLDWEDDCMPKEPDP